MYILLHHYCAAKKNQLLYIYCFLSVCNSTGHLHIHRSLQSVHVKFGDDLRLHWNGRGRVLLKVGIILILYI